MRTETRAPGPGVGSRPPPRSPPRALTCPRAEVTARPTTPSLRPAPRRAHAATPSVSPRIHADLHDRPVQALRRGKGNGPLRNLSDGRVIAETLDDADGAVRQSAPAVPHGVSSNVVRRARPAPIACIPVLACRHSWQHDRVVWSLCERSHRSRCFPRGASAIALDRRVRVYSMPEYVEGVRTKRAGTYACLLHRGTTLALQPTAPQTPLRELEHITLAGTIVAFGTFSTALTRVRCDRSHRTWHRAGRSSSFRKLAAPSTEASSRAKELLIWS